MPFREVFSVGHERSDAQFSVPKPGMMGAEVADVVQAKQPVLQHIGRKANLARKLFLFWQVQIAVPTGLTFALQFHLQLIQRQRVDDVLRLKPALPRDPRPQP